MIPNKYSKYEGKEAKGKTSPAHNAKDPRDNPGAFWFPSPSQAERKRSDKNYYVPAANVMFVILDGTTVFGKLIVLPVAVLLS